MINRLFRCLYRISIVVLAASCMHSPASQPPAARAQAGDTPVATPARSPAATRADELFWQVFHAGAYDRITDALRALDAAYLESPRDAVTAAHIGWLHIWKLGERSRNLRRDPTIADDVVLGRRYFEQAVRLAPEEPRYLGFYASMLLSEASLYDDDELRHRGVATMQRAVAAWPEFNLFTAGYGGSAAPYNSETFRHALENQLRNLEVCSGEVTTGHKRACVNTEIAPHNSEGFLLNLGDMLVKSGAPDRGVATYRRAQQLASYSAWPYRDVLEKRIEDASVNVDRFRTAHAAPGEPAMMIDSPFACMSCHQE